MKKLSVSIYYLVVVMLIKEILSECSHSRHGIQLTSSLESKNRSTACPGETVVYTCTVPDTGVLQWAIESFSTFDSNSIILTVQWDAVGTVEVQEDGLITANVTNTVPRNVYFGEITSTLTLLAHEQFNNKTIWCGNGGTSESDSSCILNYYGFAPSAPVSLSYEVISYSGSVFSVLLEWTSPKNDGGLVVSNYTIIVQSNYSFQRLITVHDKQYVSLLYNQAHTVQVSATNCRGESPPANNILNIYLVDCGPLDGLSVNASKNKISTHEGSKHTFLCSEQSVVHLECSQNGSWIQTPLNEQCSQLENRLCKTPDLPPHANIDHEKSVMGSVVVYQCDEEYDTTDTMVSVCLSGEWTPSINTFMCTRQANAVNCGVPVPPQFGLINYTDTTIGSKAVIECQDGLALTEGHVNHTSVCSPNGNWLPHPSMWKCIAIDIFPEKSESEFILCAVTGISMLFVLLPLGILCGCVCLKYVCRKKYSPTSSPQPTYEEVEVTNSNQLSGHIHMIHNEAYSVP